MNILKACTLSLALLVIATGCHKDADQTTQEGTVEQQSPEGSASTTSEVNQVGSTLEATSETEVKTSEGTENTKLEAVVGTVTEYKPGKKIEVLTGESDHHSYDLNDKDVTVEIEGTVKVGSKVTLTETTSDDGKKLVKIQVNAA